MFDSRTEELTCSHVAGAHSNDVVVLESHWDTCESDEILGIAYRLAYRNDMSDIENLDSRQEASFWRYVSCQELVGLPREARGPRHEFLSDVYGAGIDLIYLAACIYTPKPIGVVQVYGAAAESWDLETARVKAIEGGKLLKANLHRAFPHSRLDNLSRGLGHMIWEQLTGLSDLTTLLGYPDTRKVQAADGDLGHSGDAISSQQGEFLLRSLGLGSRHCNFVFLVTAAPVRHTVLSEGLQNVNYEWSDYKSRERGSVSIGVSMDKGPYIKHSWQTEDDVSILMAGTYSHIQTIWDSMAAAGGFLTTVRLFTAREYQTVGVGGLRMAFGGGSPIPVQPLHVNALSVHEVERQRLLAQTCLSSVELFDRADDAIGTGYLPRYSTILPAHMVAAYMAPNVFEDGRTNTVQPPPLVF